MVNYSSATEIIKDVDILIAIRWAPKSWTEVSGAITKKGFEKCMMVKSDNLRKRN